jgi:hypothetical protein
MRGTIEGNQLPYIWLWNLTPQPLPQFLKRNTPQFGQGDHIHQPLCFGGFNRIYQIHQFFTFAFREITSLLLCMQFYKPSMDFFRQLFIDSKKQLICLNIHAQLNLINCIFSYSSILTISRPSPCHLPLAIAPRPSLPLLAPRKLLLAPRNHLVSFKNLNSSLSVDRIIVVLSSSDFSSVSIALRKLYRSLDCGFLL